MMPNRILSFTIGFIRIALLLCWLPSVGQSYAFKVYDTNSGLPQNFVYTLVQGNDGYLWMGTGEGLVRFDGLKFKVFNEGDSLSSAFIHDLLVDKNGILWAGHDNGTLSFYKNHQFFKVKPEGTSSPIKDMAAADNGLLWCVEQNNGLFSVDSSGTVTNYFNRKLFGRKIYYSVCVVDTNTLLVGTSDGLLKVSLRGVEIEDVSEITSVLPSVINVITARKNSPGEFWIGTEDKGLFLFKIEGNDAKPVLNSQDCFFVDVQTENITGVVEEDEGHLLITTWGKGVLKLVFDPLTNTYSKLLSFTQQTGLPNDYVSDILKDREGNYWYATYGGGTAALLNEQFIFYSLEQIGFKRNKVNSVISYNTDLLMGLDDGILKTNPFCFSNSEYLDVVQGIPRTVITGFYVDDKNVLWVATIDKGLFKREPGSSSFKKYNYAPDNLSNQINGIEGDAKNIYLATMGGFFVINRASGTVDQYTTERNLPHNNINFVRIDAMGRIWIGPKASGICSIDVEKATIDVHRVDDSAIDVMDVASDNEGNLWLATKGRGILKYNDSSLVSVTSANGLLKNFCYSLAIDSHNRLWVCHHPGVSCVNLKDMSVRQFDGDSQMGGDFQKVWKSRDNTLWFASSEGVVHYFPDKDVPNNVAPVLSFSSIEIDGKPYPLNKPISLPYRYGKNYTFKFNFIGISLKDAAGVKYKYKLEEVGDDESDWLDIGSTNSREYDFMPDGDYVLKVIAYNSDGVVTSNPLALKVSIKAPVWKKLWFYLLIVSLLVYVVYLIVRRRERQLIYQKRLLQDEVASQTVVLRSQKAEIERKNRDITDSINYAKRIQASILPSLNVLRSVFPDSFIYFAPRDIVSGDFYWFYQKKDIMVVSVADCTGHGVPGAFMSMIGSTLLNDLIKKNTVVSPADLLENLDKEIKTLLQKNSAELSQDGMDISIVEIHIPTRSVRLASAKRPVYLYINGEMTIYKGARRSIGESLIDTDGRFVNLEYQLSKGDEIYLFSDGYTDQFGGPQSKKFMKVGVQNLLDTIHELPMVEQGQIVKDTFEKWKGDVEQIDDVIFLGIRL